MSVGSGLERTLATLCALVLAVIAATAPARAETRVALVIGNSNYAHAPHLANPPNDAATVASALRRAGFTTVTVRQDLGQVQFKAALQEFARLARAADVAVIDYSGHGIEVGGQNYLVPVDATLASARTWSSRPCRSTWCFTPSMAPDVCASCCSTPAATTPSPPA